MTQPQAQQFFASYQAGFNAADACAVTNHYAFPCVFSQSLVPGVFANHADLLANNEKLIANYAADGFERADFALERVHAYGNAHAVVDVAWTITRRALAATPTPRPSVRFRTAYNLRQMGGTSAPWKIWAVTVYEETVANPGARLS
jgi:hypothetical protein